MSNTSKDLFNKENATNAKSQDLIANDGSRQSINLISNLVQTSETMGFHENGPKTSNIGINV